MATAIRSTNRATTLLSDKALIALNLVAEEYGLAKHDILGESRIEPLPEARYVIYYLLMNDFSIARISVMFKKSRSTVMHGHQNIKDLAYTYPKMGKWLKEMETKINTAWEEQLA